MISKKSLMQDLRKLNDFIEQRNEEVSNNIKMLKKGAIQSNKAEESESSDVVKHDPHTTLEAYFISLQSVSANDLRVKAKVMSMLKKLSKAYTELSGEVESRTKTEEALRADLAKRTDEVEELKAKVKKLQSQRVKSLEQVKNSDCKSNRTYKERQFSSPPPRLSSKVGSTATNASPQLVTLAQKAYMNDIKELDSYVDSLEASYVRMLDWIKDLKLQSSTSVSLANKLFQEVRKIPTVKGIYDKNHPLYEKLMDMVETVRKAQGEQIVTGRPKLLSGLHKSGAIIAGSGQKSIFDVGRQRGNSPNISKTLGCDSEDRGCECGAASSTRIQQGTSGRTPRVVDKSSSRYKCTVPIDKKATPGSQRSFGPGSQTKVILGSSKVRIEAIEPKGTRAVEDHPVNAIEDYSDDGGSDRVAVKVNTGLGNEVVGMKVNPARSSSSVSSSSDNSHSSVSLSDKAGGSDDKGEYEEYSTYSYSYEEEPKNTK